MNIVIRSLQRYCRSESFNDFCEIFNYLEYSILNSINFKTKVIDNFIIDILVINLKHICS